MANSANFSAGKIQDVGGAGGGASTGGAPVTGGGRSITSPGNTSAPGQGGNTSPGGGRVAPGQGGNTAPGVPVNPRPMTTPPASSKNSQAKITSGEPDGNITNTKLAPLPSDYPSTVNGWTYVSDGHVTLLPSSISGLYDSLSKLAQNAIASSVTGQIPFTGGQSDNVLYRMRFRFSIESTTNPSSIKVEGDADLVFRAPLQSYSGFVDGSTTGWQWTDKDGYHRQNYSSVPGDLVTFLGVQYVVRLDGSPDTGGDMPAPLLPSPTNPNAYPQPQPAPGEELQPKTAPEIKPFTDLPSLPSLAPNPPAVANPLKSPAISPSYSPLPTTTPLPSFTSSPTTPTKETGFTSLPVPNPLPSDQGRITPLPVPVPQTVPQVEPQPQPALLPPSEIAKIKTATKQAVCEEAQPDGCISVSIRRETSDCNIPTSSILIKIFSGCDPDTGEATYIPTALTVPTVMASAYQKEFNQLYELRARECIIPQVTEVVYGIPVVDFQRANKFAPHLTLHFSSSRDPLMTGNEKNVVRGTIRVRLKNETSATFTPTKAQALADRIKALFAPNINNLYPWYKGKYKSTYQTDDGNYDLRPLCDGQTSAINLITQVLAIQYDSFDSSNYQFINNSKSFSSSTGQSVVYGDLIDNPIKRPTTLIKFRFAQLAIHGRPRPVNLVDTTNRLHNALIYVN